MTAPPGRLVCTCKHCGTATRATRDPFHTRRGPQGDEATAFVGMFGFTF